MKSDKWLQEQIETVREHYESAESDAMAYQYAAEIETYNRLLEDTLPFGEPRKALEVYQANNDTPDYGMTAGRVRALKNYLELE